MVSAFDNPTRLVQLLCQLLACFVLGGCATCIKLPAPLPAAAPADSGDAGDSTVRAGVNAPQDTQQADATSPAVPDRIAFPDESVFEPTAQERVALAEATLDKKPPTKGQVPGKKSSARRTATGKNAAGQNAAKQESIPKPPDNVRKVRPPKAAKTSSSQETPSPEEVVPAGSLKLADVLESLYQSYPLLRAALQERGVAFGKLVESHGAFDFKLKGGGTTGPLGFYQTTRSGVGFEQAMFGGGNWFAGYRVGRGNFQPWYGERETNDGGELKAGLRIPLKQNRAIDARRARIFQAALRREAVEPDILIQLLTFVRAASHVYWEWVAAGQNVQIEKDLLAIAQRRQDGLKKRVDRGDLPRIDLTDNRRLIVSRRASLIDARRKLRQATIKLSLFLRSPDGQPQLATATSLPGAFPQPTDPQQLRIEDDIEQALVSRPETLFLDLVRQQIVIDVAQAENLYLPQIDIAANISQDVGPPASKKRDKSPLELEAGIVLSLPLQRSKATGKLRAAQAKLRQLRVKTQFARDKIAADVRTAHAALLAAASRIGQARQSVELNQQMEEAERKRFAAGNSNLLIVNLREKATADARKVLVTALLEFYRATADYRAALGSVPVRQETDRATNQPR